MKLLRKVYGFAESRKQLKAKLSDVSGRVLEHILKCFMYPEDDATHHWKSEVRGFLPYVKKEATTNKLPSQQFILENTWKLVDDLIDMMYLNIQRWYRDKPDPEFGPSELYLMCEEFFIQWSVILSEYGQISLQEVSILVDEIVVNHTRRKDANL